ncbi:glycerophosphodiester phosphodiesterase [Brachybacterium sp. p3-SID1565]|uniref:glycerophosphodiester phosphodiesterase n=1 Tax=Brachybacterium sp. p3-SID1565 TaxID=2916046 RepID=UPI0021A6B8A0|nr:glycerophosphodiester phosphodiesterase family protein [Brachybacterium sp. p3-SID1565]MCT1384632.1 glycerophosphodiester phosphodiesterase [Brachybacterium sp. p3-SID1565]
MTRTQPLVVGHRGAAHLAPENTLSSFRRALADGADLLECDVHLSRDGQVIVMHDETIDRTANPYSPLRTGAIADLTADELGRVRLQHDEHVPTLAQLLDLTTVPLFIEVKVPAAARVVGELLAQLDEGSTQAASTVISFHPEALAEIRRTSPDTPVSYLVRTIDELALATARELGATAIGPAIDGLCLAAARAAREAGLRVHPWTINTPEQLAVALACGVDSITTDDPGWVKEQLAERSTHR